MRLQAQWGPLPDEVRHRACHIPKGLPALPLGFAWLGAACVTTTSTTSAFDKNDPGMLCGCESLLLWLLEHAPAEQQATVQRYVHGLLTTALKALSGPDAPKVGDDWFVGSVKFVAGAVWVAAAALEQQLGVCRQAAGRLARESASAAAAWVALLGCCCIKAAGQLAGLLQQLEGARNLELQRKFHEAVSGAVQAPAAVLDPGNSSSGTSSSDTSGCSDAFSAYCSSHGVSFTQLQHAAASLAAAAQAALPCCEIEEHPVGDVHVEESAAQPAMQSHLQGFLQQLRATGQVLSSLPSKLACNNPGCSHMSGATERRAVRGKVCSRCKKAVYCSQECLTHHVLVHRAVCTAVSAAAASSKQ